MGQRHTGISKGSEIQNQATSLVQSRPIFKHLEILTFLLDGAIATMLIEESSNQCLKLTNYHLIRHLIRVHFIHS